MKTEKPQEKSQFFSIYLGTFKRVFRMRFISSNISDENILLLVKGHQS